MVHGVVHAYTSRSVYAKADRSRSTARPGSQGHGGGQQLGNASGNDAEQPSRLMEHNAPADHDSSTRALSGSRARQPIVDVVTPADPPLVNRAAATALLRLLSRAYQDRTGASSIASP
jgi:hypothetical protein